MYKWLVPHLAYSDLLLPSRLFDSGSKLILIVLVRSQRPIVLSADVQITVTAFLGTAGLISAKDL